jgi:DNA-binding winged helix-turn-helix (wHTH) protein/Tfp pilus assembly protein PilF
VPISEEKTEVFEFGPFRLDPTERVLIRNDGETVAPLPDKAFRTLTHLVKNHGHLASKSDLMNVVWPDSFVEENNLEKCIYAIRIALGDSSRDEKYIQTVRKHGYRFVADVRKLARESNKFSDGNPETATVTGSGALGAYADSRDRSHVIRFIKLALGTLAAFILITALIYFLRSYVEIGDSAASKSNGTNNPEAFAFFAEAVKYKGRPTKSAATESISNFEKAIQVDPNFARAYAGLARSRIDLANLVDESGPDCAIARVAAAKSLELDHRLAEGYEALGLQNYRCDWDFEGAGRAFTRSIQLDPGDASAHYNYAWYLNSVGRNDVAQAEAERALSIEPDSELYLFQRALFLYFNRQYDESLAQLKRVAELSSGKIGVGWIWLVCDMKGDQPQALEWFLKTLDPELDRTTIDELRSLYLSGGWQAVRLKQRQIEISNSNYSKGKYYRIARISTLIGEKEIAFEYLNKALERRDAQLLMLKSEPAFEGLHSDPRFAILLSRIGFGN